MPYTLRVDHEYPSMGRDQIILTEPLRVPSDSVEQQTEAVEVNSRLQHEAQQAWNRREEPAYGKDGIPRWWVHTSYNEAKREPISDMFKTEPEPRQEVANPQSHREVTNHVSPKTGSEKIPADIIRLAKYINGLPKNTKGRQLLYPSYNCMRHDEKLDKEVGKRTGRLSQGSKLRPWLGDERLFSKEMWRYLTEFD